MSVPSMEELVETFLDGSNFIRNSTARECARAGLLAVLDRLKPVVAEAYAAGERDENSGYWACPREFYDGDDYATRKIDKIKGA